LTGSGFHKVQKHSIKIWDLTKKKCIATIEKAHNDTITEIKLIDDSCFVSCSLDHTVKIWSFEKKEPLFVFKEKQKADEKPFYCIAANKKNFQVVAGTGPHMPESFGSLHPEPYMAKQGRFDNLKAKQNILVWDFVKAEEIARFPGAHDDCINSLEFYQDIFILSTSADLNVKIWSMDKKEIEHIINVPHKHFVLYAGINEKQ